LHLESRPSLFAETPAAHPLTGNLFFALYPDSGTAARIGALARDLRGEHGLAGKLLKTENFHVSLLPLAGFPGSPRAKVDAACAAAMAVSFRSFDIVFDRAGSFLCRGRDRHPFVLQGSEGLVAVRTFRQALQVEMRKAGFGATARGFTPHLTMLYDRSPVEVQAIDLLRWRVEEFVLVESLFGRATQIPLGRWRLGSRGRPWHAELDRGFISAAGAFRSSEEATIA
jgi:RNA 2',3'-cyclic 3'-phosphodiesterase